MLSKLTSGSVQKLDTESFNLASISIRGAGTSVV
jgi:hypothetical protein